MGSGTIYGDYSKDWRLRIDYSYTQDVSSNTSTITSNLYVYAGHSTYNNYSNSAYYEIQGARTYATFNFSNAWYYLGSNSSISKWRKGCKIY